MWLDLPPVFHHLHSCTKKKTKIEINPAVHMCPCQFLNDQQNGFILLHSVHR